MYIYLVRRMNVFSLKMWVLYKVCTRTSKML